MPDENLVKHTKSFKKYTSEFKSELVDAARAYVSVRNDFTWHEDRSLLKVTSTKANIEAMSTVLRARFGALPGDEAPEEKKEEKKA